jgi:alanyl-tRNA synthetase
MAKEAPGMESAEIARRWLSFFEARGHTVVPSASLIADDPTLLLVNAGMVPFKPFFLGEEPAPYPRAASIQKVVRTLDIDEVGRTTRHASFFQMCGNFSFGDYFKEKAIPLAWELLTTSVEDGGYGLDPERLWVTVFHDDDESAEIWHRDVGVPLERIQRRGMADNFWSMGVPGPCGPCSEIYYDRGPEYGLEGGPVVDEDRYLEVWNLVFMQFMRGEGQGKDDFPILGNLPAPSIDTGLGLERMAALLQGVENIYEIDTTRRIIETASRLTGRPYGVDAESDVRLRVVGDHARTSVMLIGDGISPGNEGRGYVLRRIMRRVVRSMRLLGASGPTMVELASTTIDVMSAQYPELERDRARILAVTQAEEDAFSSTLRTGTMILDTAVAAARAGGSASLSGEEAFALHDTYGFPIDLTLEMAAEQGVAVDEEGFRRLMAEQRRRAKADAQAKKTGHVDVSAYRAVLDSAGPSSFTGYDEIVTETALLGLLVDGDSVDSAAAGTDVEVVLSRTPFYAEGGGQLADAGLIELDDGTLIQVTDVQAPVGGLVVHRGRVLHGEAVRGRSAIGRVDVQRREAISRAHTATHLVHKAFREALGETATQAGSENAPGRFRFDFSSTGAVPPMVLRDVEATVNDVLAADLAVTAETMTQEQARAIGAMALFGEKYGDKVRVVSVGDWARELCGGTHATSSSQVGVIKLLGESSIGSGVRRVEALVGADAYRFLAREHLLVHELSTMLKARPDELPERVSGMLTRLKDADRELAAVHAERLRAQTGRIADQAIEVGGVQLLTFAAPAGTSGGDLRQIVVDARGALPADRPCVVVGVAESEGKVAAVAAVNDAAQSSGHSAQTLLRAALERVGGRGGGKDDLAQGGGSDPSGIPAALDAVAAAVRDTAGV